MAQILSSKPILAVFSSVTAFVLYVTIKKLLQIKPCKSNHTKKIILSLSSCTFSIYLIHLLSMRLLNTNPEFLAFYNSKGLILMVILWLALSVITFALSLYHCSGSKKNTNYQGSVFKLSLFGIIIYGLGFCAGLNMQRRIIPTSMFR